jgi:ketosteroid isomerase-like protein
MSTVERHEYVRLLDRIIAAAEAGDPSDLENVYWPDAVIWHNHDNREQTVQQNMKVLVAMGRFVEQRQYVDRRIHVFDGGIVQQHVLKGVRVRDGEPVELHACVVVTVRDGRITRLDEYLDSGEVANFWS